jgi:hypothetical protein
MQWRLVMNKSLDSGRATRFDGALGGDVMGIFDGFGGKGANLTPHMALVAGMIYISAADGHLDDSEAGDSSLLPTRLMASPMKK